MESLCASKEKFEEEKELLEQRLEDTVFYAEQEFFVKEINEKVCLLEGFNTEELDLCERRNTQIKDEIVGVHS